jgi:hypothetical protein
MKTETLIDYLEELDDAEVCRLYHETPANILRSFNCSPAQLRSVIDEEFPDSVEEDGDGDESE